MHVAGAVQAPEHLHCSAGSSVPPNILPHVPGGDPRTHAQVSRRHCTSPFNNGERDDPGPTASTTTHTASEAQPTAYQCTCTRGAPATRPIDPCEVPLTLMDHGEHDAHGRCARICQDGVGFGPFRLPRGQCGRKRGPHCGGLGFGRHEWYVHVAQDLPEA